MLYPLNLPPGVHRNGTDMQSANRWRDVNLVRWYEQTMQPIGGWRKKSLTAASTKIRGMLAWIDNSGDQQFVAGCSDKLYYYDNAGNQTDITPAGFTTGNEDAVSDTGYGYGAYSAEYYGTARTEGISITPATTWAMDNWGEYWVGCTEDDGKLYEWQLDSATPTLPAAISGAPTSCRSLVVTEERILMALGAGGNGRKVQWCDREDNTTWTPLATNEAGDFELTTFGLLECGIRVKDGTLLLTTTDAHLATYIGPQLIFSFNKVGDNCGVISKKAVANTDIGAVWMGRNSFFVFDGADVKPLPSEVSDYVFSDINRSQVSKVFAVNNSKYSEVWFHYPSGASTENDRYVVWNYAENTWNIGQMCRTSGIDQGAYTYPIWAKSSDKHTYYHEFGYNYGGEVPYAETGPIVIENGESTFSVLKLIPDEKNQGEVTAIFKTRFHPNNTERSYGPYSLTNPTSVRFTGRQVRMRVTSVANDHWRVGVNRVDVRMRGKR